MVFSVCVDVLHVGLVIDQVWHRSDEVPAGVKHIQHGPPVLVKGQPVVDLHFPVDPGVVPFLEVHPLPLHQGSNALRAV